LPPINYKTVFKADYKPRLDFYEHMFSMATALPDYPDWVATGLATTVQNLEDWCSVSLTYNSFMYCREIQKDNEKYGDRKRIHKMFEVVLPKLGVETFERIGLRCWFLSAVTMTFEQLVEVVSKHFLVDNKDIREGICPEPTDVAYAVHFMDNKFKVQLRVGPVRKNELELQFGPNRNVNVPVSKRTLPPDELFANFPDVSLLMDIDVSRTAVKSKEVLEAFEQGQQIQERLSQNIAKYVFGVKG
jgi:hypothetical protein